MKRVHQLKAGDLIRTMAQSFALLKMPGPAMAFPFGIVRRKMQAFSRVRLIAASPGRMGERQVVPVYFSPDTPWLFQGNFSAGLFHEVTQ
jgi:hypothetical protein